VGGTNIHNALDHGREIISSLCGKAERKGVSRSLSFNLSNIRKNNHAFGRWRYGLAYHTRYLKKAGKEKAFEVYGKRRG